MSRYPGPPTNTQGQPLSSVGVYPPPGMSGHMPSPQQTVPSYNVAVASPSQYVQQPVQGPSPTQGHYTHPSVIKFQISTNHLTLFSLKKIFIFCLCMFYSDLTLLYHLSSITNLSLLSL